MEGFKYCESDKPCQHRVECPGPLGWQQFPVMVGKLIGGGVCLQTEHGYVKIQHEDIKETAMAMLAMHAEEKECR